MEFKNYYSSSEGNLYSISDGQTSLLIECGISIKGIRKALNYSLSSFSGCLISHSHQDHAKSVKDIMKSGVDCYMSPETANSLEVSGHRVKIITARVPFTVGTFDILPFGTIHDCDGSLAFLILSDKSKLLFAVDTCFLPYSCHGVTHICIECNYSDETINPELPKELINRIKLNHMSLDAVKSFLLACDLSMTKEIHLLHLSDNNSDKELFKSEIERLTGKPVYL